MGSTPQVELDAAQALFAARLLSSAVHHPGPWFFRWGDVQVPAERRHTETGVTFVGQFPEVCYLHRPEGGLVLLCEDEGGPHVMAIRSVEEHEHPGDTGFVVTWDVLAQRPRVPR